MIKIRNILFGVLAVLMVPAVIFAVKYGIQLYFIHEIQQQRQEHFVRWRHCDVDADCIIKSGACAQWQPINKAYSKLNLGAHSICFSTLIPDHKPEAACINHLCEAVQVNSALGAASK